MTATAEALAAGASTFPDPAGPDAEELVNDARPVSARRLLAELWKRRELVSVLARKDFFVRYRRSKLGLIWVFMVPLIQALVLSVVFSRVGRFSATIPHYPIYVFSGFIAWSFFSSNLVTGSTAIVDGKDLAVRIYFPRIVLPIVKLLTDSYTLGSTVAILLVLALAFGVHLGLAVLLLIPAMALLMALALGFSLILSSIHVYFRDVRFIVGALVMPWFYVTPIFYDPSQMHGILRDVVRVNPATGALDLFRAATVGAAPDWQVSIPIAAVLAGALLLVGFTVQRRLDRNFLDLL